MTNTQQLPHIPQELIWRQLDDKAVVVSPYQITPEEASRDLQAFLTQLSERGLIVWQDEPVDN